MSTISNVSVYDLHTRIRRPIIESMLQVQKGEIILDVGSGSGYLAEGIAEGNDCTICLDISLENLCSVKKGKRGNLLLINSSAETLPFRSGSFDKVLCAEVLEHISEDRQALRELARILKPGGVLVITVPCSDFTFPSLIELLNIKTVHDYDGPEKHFRKGYTLSGLSQSLGKAGLVMCSQKYFCHFFSKLILDAISITHLAVRRVAMGQKAWTWADIQSLNTKRSFTIYKLLFPLFLVMCRIDMLLLRRPRSKGSGIAIASKKQS
jgi:ubiquinone/menaquinone biosynthesis C-methylase UbiE